MRKTFSRLSEGSIVQGEILLKRKTALKITLYSTAQSYVHLITAVEMSVNVNPVLPLVPNSALRISYLSENKRSTNTLIALGIP